MTFKLNFKKSKRPFQGDTQVDATGNVRRSSVENFIVSVLALCLFLKVLHSAKIVLLGTIDRTNISTIYYFYLSVSFLNLEDFVLKLYTLLWLKQFFQAEVIFFWANMWARQLRFWFLISQAHILANVISLWIHNQKRYLTMKSSLMILWLFVFLSLFLCLGDMTLLSSFCYPLAFLFSSAFSSSSCLFSSQFSYFFLLWFKFLTTWIYWQTRSPIPFMVSCTFAIATTFFFRSVFSYSTDIFITFLKYSSILFSSNLFVVFRSILQPNLSIGT